MKTSISYSYCNWLKFFSCILIFSGHYLFRDYSKVVGDFGFLGTIIFFFLSAYGIVLSQSKKNLTISNFILRRVVKVWLPLLCVNFIFILLESFLNGDFLIYKFHLHSPYIEVIKDLNIGTMLLFLLDIYQMDPLTWFLHELIFAYLLIFFLMKIGNRKIRILTSISLYVVFELLFYVFQFPLMQKINTIGILLGFLYSNMGGHYLAYLNRKKYLFLISFLAVKVIDIIWASSGFLNSYWISDLFKIMYCSFLVMFVVMLGEKRTLKNSTLSIFLGGVSFYVYLVHMKVIDLMNWEGFGICLFLSILLAVFLYKFIQVYIINKIFK